jgi:hypothetical protein
MKIINVDSMCVRIFSFFEVTIRGFVEFWILLSVLEVVMLQFSESWLTIRFVSWMSVRGICAVGNFSKVQNGDEYTKKVI